MASGIGVAGMLLIGFGVLIAALPQIFAYLVAALFILVGIGCGATALKIMWSQRRAGTMDTQEPVRRNVRVRQTEIFDGPF
jgi:hypothetical protein